MARQTALDREKANVTKLKSKVEELRTTISVQRDSLERKDIELADKQQGFTHKIEELARQNETIEDLRTDLDNSLDKDTTEFLLVKFSGILEAVVGKITENDC